MSIHALCEAANMHNKAHSAPVGSTSSASPAGPGGEEWSMHTLLCLDSCHAPDGLVSW